MRDRPGPDADQTDVAVLGAGDDEPFPPRDDPADVLERVGSPDRVGGADVNRRLRTHRAAEVDGPEDDPPVLVAGDVGEAASVLHEAAAVEHPGGRVVGRVVGMAEALPLGRPDGKAIRRIRREKISRGEDIDLPDFPSRTGRERLEENRAALPRVGGAPEESDRSVPPADGEPLPIDPAERLGLEVCPPGVQELPRGLGLRSRDDVQGQDQEDQEPASLLCARPPPAEG